MTVPTILKDRYDSIHHTILSKNLILSNYSLNLIQLQHYFTLICLYYYSLICIVQVTCSQGCGIEVPLDEMQKHNCIQQLRNTLMAHIYTLESKLSACEAEIERLREVRNQTPITGDNMNQAGPSSARESAGAAKPHNLSDEEIRSVV